jgi:1-acyl-sn-glycerol-3-phosphate acyltransferase
MGKLFANIVRFFISKPLFFVVLFLAIVSFLIIGVGKLNINEDLYSIFPKSEQYQRFNKIVQENSLNKQIIFSIDAIQDEDELEDKLINLEEQLNTQFEGRISDLIIYRNVNEKKLIRYFQKSFVLNAHPIDYEEIERKITKTSIAQSLANDAKKLEGSDGFFMKSFIAQDPLGIANEQLENVRPEEGKGAYVVKDGLVYTQDEKSILFFASIVPDRNDTKALYQLNDDLESFKTKLNAKEKLNFDFFGTFQIAVENARQVKADTYLTAFLSLGLILLLLVLYYRSLLAPFYFLLPAVFGVLCGLGMVGYLQPDISSISLATASVLLGIVLDYSFHFFTHYKHSGDILSTIKDVSAPMIIGSFTTIAALGALLFAESVILQNFGMIALFTLLGSVLFTLLLQPVIFVLLKVNLPNSVQKTKDRKLPKMVLRIGILLVIFITAGSLFRGFDASFDADVNRLSFHTDELKKKEAFYTGINPNDDKKFYVIASATSEDKARALNAEIFDTLQTNRKELGISELISTAPYLPNQEKIAQGERNWLTFWSSRKDQVEKDIAEASAQNNFSSTAFDPFYKWISENTFDPEKGESLAQDLGLTKFQFSSENEQSYITSIVIDRGKLAECKVKIHSVDGAFILDISEITEMMLTSVQNDFNFLLLFSVLLVFITLLIIYGRIELALFAFLPMLLAWIWILGITNLLDIKFNFVNIIITTFIFGLGDDFSIFTTDGLMQQYKTGSDSYKSYRSAIILSGITTLLGTGVLIFAHHPAINSIALVSIIGISTILIITLFVQPLLFNLFVFNRTNQGKPPITFFTLLYSIFLYTYFLFGSIFLTLLVVFVLFPVPIKKVKKRQFLNFLVSRLAKSTIYAGFHIKKEVLVDKIDFSKPNIIIANHSSFLDILLVLMINPKTVIMVKSWVYNSPVFGLFIRYAGFPFAKEGADDNLKQIRERIAEGYQVVIFPEGTRSKDGTMNRFHKGAFHIANELQMDIQPIVISGAHEANPKNDILINRGKITIKALDLIPYDENITYSQTTKIAKRVMVEGMAETKKEHGGTDFWGPILLKNFVLKGPILEWYVRVKWRLEKANFAFYDKLIDDRKVIYDFGCGYGYLSHYLYYRNNERIIKGIDYDKDKIEIAEHAITIKKDLSFESNDIRQVDVQACDVLFLNDVLHYLPKSDQDNLLQKIVGKLNANGILMIRDGLKGEERSYKMTKLTEFFSTKVFGFNKAEHPLEFISEEDMQEFAKKNNLEIEIQKHSKTTSNVLIILRKRD